MALYLGNKVYPPVPFGQDALAVDKPVQFAVDYRRQGRPEIGGAEMDRAAGMGITARGGSTPQPQQDVTKFEDALHRWAAGEMPAKDVQKFFKDAGWSLDLRRGRYDVEAIDPTGKYHYLQP